MQTERTEITNIVDDAISKLREHCDSVQIFVTFPQEDGTADYASYNAGAGNHYAKLGQIREWLLMQDHYLRHYSDRCERRERPE